ncbi:MAG: hypothetical protein JKY37_20660 [Nannocystaceae bacterium]|nr:hypothetical protein [Nannocystaceae bacterium]
MGFALVSAPVALPAIPLAIALAAAGTGAMAVAYRALYHRVLNKTETELENALATVALSSRPWARA